MMREDHVGKIIEEFLKGEAPRHNMYSFKLADNDFQPPT